MEKRDVLANIDPDLLRGEGVVDFNVMFSGKTFRIRQQVDAIEDMNKHRSKKRQIGYVVINNAVDTSVASGATYSRRVGSIPALTIPRANPEKAIDLRENFSCVQPGYHMNKKHWNTIICDGSAGSKQLFAWIDDSYNLVVESLTKKLKTELENL